MANDAGAGAAKFFSNRGAVASNVDFLRTYVTAVPTVPESAWQASAKAGKPVVCYGEGAPDPIAQAAGHLRAVAARF